MLKLVQLFVIKSIFTGKLLGKQEKEAQMVLERGFFLKELKDDIPPIPSMHWTLISDTAFKSYTCIKATSHLTALYKNTKMIASMINLATH